jgi:hypothetical protein
LGEVVKVNDNTIDIMEFNIAKAINKTAKNGMEDFKSVGDRVAIVEGEVGSNFVRIQRHIVLVVVDIHNSVSSSGSFCHGQLLLDRFCTRICITKPLIGVCCFSKIVILSRTDSWT